MEKIKTILISIVFVLIGIYILNYHDGRIWVGWMLILTFGLGGALYIFIQIYTAITGKKSFIEQAEQIHLKSGENYEVQITSNGINLVNLVSLDKQFIDLAELTEVYAVAIDGFPIGSISWMLHKGETSVEIPWGASNGDDLLAYMQSNLSGFDNNAVIEISSILHGYKKIWSRV